MMKKMIGCFVLMAIPLLASNTSDVLVVMQQQNVMGMEKKEKSVSFVDNLDDLDRPSDDDVIIKYNNEGISPDDSGFQIERNMQQQFADSLFHDEGISPDDSGRNSTSQCESCLEHTTAMVKACFAAKNHINNTKEVHGTKTPSVKDEHFLNSPSPDRKKQVDHLTTTPSPQTNQNTQSKFMMLKSIPSVLSIESTASFGDCATDTPSPKKPINKDDVSSSLVATVIYKSFSHPTRTPSDVFTQSKCFPSNPFLDTMDKQKVLEKKDSTQDLIDHQ